MKTLCKAESPESEHNIQNRKMCGQRHKETGDHSHNRGEYKLMQPL